MQISIFQLGQLSTNCYIVTDEQTKGCAVLDPGASGDQVADWLQSQELTPRCILLTHGHFDHVGGVAALRERYPEIPVYIHEADTHLTAALSQGLQWTDHYAEGDAVTADGLTFRVLHTPGHTPGSVCLQCEDMLFTGDTLFEGSCGRTDLPGGSWRQMQASLRRLAALQGDFGVLPGHGQTSDLDVERVENPYMKEAMER